MDQKLETQNSIILNKSQSLNEKEEKATKTGKRKSIWKNLYHSVFKRDKTQHDKDCTPKSKHTRKKLEKFTSFFKNQKYAFTTINILEHDSKNFKSAQSFDELKGKSVAMAIKLPSGITHQNTDIIIELEMLKKNSEKTTDNCQTPQEITQLKLTEDSDLEAIYSGSIKVPSNTDVAKLANMPLYLFDCNEELVLNPNLGRKPHVIIKPAMNSLADNVDQKWIVGDLNLKIKFIRAAKITKPEGATCNFLDCRFINVNGQDNSNSLLINEEEIAIDDLQVKNMSAETLQDGKPCCSKYISSNDDPSQQENIMVEASCTCQIDETIEHSCIYNNNDTEPSTCTCESDESNNRFYLNNAKCSAYTSPLQSDVRCIINNKQSGIIVPTNSPQVVQISGTLNSGKVTPVYDNIDFDKVGDTQNVEGEDYTLTSSCNKQIIDFNDNTESNRNTLEILQNARVKLLNFVGADDANYVEKLTAIKSEEINKVCDLLPTDAEPSLQAEKIEQVALPNDTDFLKRIHLNEANLSENLGSKKNSECSICKQEFDTQIHEEITNVSGKPQEPTTLTVKTEIVAPEKILKEPPGAAADVKLTLSQFEINVVPTLVIENEEEVHKIIEDILINETLKKVNEQIDLLEKCLTMTVVLQQQSIETNNERLYDTNKESVYNYNKETIEVSETLLPSDCECIKFNAAQNMYSEHSIDRTDALQMEAYEMLLRERYGAQNFDQQNEKVLAYSVVESDVKSMILDLLSESKAIKDTILNGSDIRHGSRCDICEICDELCNKSEKIEDIQYIINTLLERVHAETQEIGDVNGKFSDNENFHNVHNVRSGGTNLQIGDVKSSTHSANKKVESKESLKNIVNSPKEYITNINNNHSVYFCSANSRPKILKTSWIFGQGKTSESETKQEGKLPNVTVTRITPTKCNIIKTEDKLTNVLEKSTHLLNNIYQELCMYDRMNYKNKSLDLNETEDFKEVYSNLEPFAQYDEFGLVSDSRNMKTDNLNSENCTKNKFKESETNPDGFVFHTNEYKTDYSKLVLCSSLYDRIDQLNKLTQSKEIIRIGMNQPCSSSGGCVNDENEKRNGNISKKKVKNEYDNDEEEQEIQTINLDDPSSIKQSLTYLKNVLKAPSKPKVSSINLQKDDKASVNFKSQTSFKKFSVDKSSSIAELSYRGSSFPSLTSSRSRNQITKESSSSTDDVVSRRLRPIQRVTKNKEDKSIKRKSSCPSLCKQKKEPQNLIKKITEATPGCSTRSSVSKLELSARSTPEESEYHADKESSDINLPNFKRTFTSQQELSSPSEIAAIDLNVQQNDWLSQHPPYALVEESDEEDEKS